MKAIAILLTIILAVSYHDDSTQQVEDFLVGFFSAFGKWNFDFTSCIQNSNQVAESIVKLFKIANSLDWKNIKKVIEFVNTIMGSINFMLSSVQDCPSIPDDMKQMIGQILEESSHNHEMAIIKNIASIVHQGMNFYYDLNKNDFKAAGKDIGTVTFIILLSKEYESPVVQITKLISGILNSIGELLPINNLQRCTFESELLLKKITNAFIHIRFTGIRLFLSSMKELCTLVHEYHTQSAVCFSESRQDIALIINAMTNKSLLERLEIIARHADEVLYYSYKSIGVLSTIPFNPYQFGTDVGHIFNIIFLMAKESE